MNQDFGFRADLPGFATRAARVAGRDFAPLVPRRAFEGAFGFIFLPVMILSLPASHSPGPAAPGRCAWLRLRRFRCPNEW